MKVYDAKYLHERAVHFGFKRDRSLNWIRRSDELLQLVNLQGSIYSKTQNYLNFAIWPLALGEPPEMKERLFPFRMRPHFGPAADDPEAFLRWATTIDTLQDLREAIRNGSAANSLRTTEIEVLLAR